MPDCHPTQMEKRYLKFQYDLDVPHQHSADVWWLNLYDLQMCDAQDLLNRPNDLIREETELVLLHINKKDLFQSCFFRQGWPESV